MNRDIYKFFIIIFVCLTAGTYVLAKESVPGAVKVAQSAVFKVESSSDGSVYGSGFFIGDGKTFVTTFDLMYKLVNLKGSEELSSILLTGNNKKFQIKSIKGIFPLDNIVFLETETRSEYFLRFSDRGVLYRNNRNNRNNTYTVGFLELGPIALEWAQLLEGSENELSLIRNHKQTIKSATGGPALNRQGEMIGIHLSSFQIQDQNISTILKVVYLRSLLNQNAMFESGEFSVVEQFQNALKDLESLAERGDTRAQLALANILFKMGSMNSASRWYREAAKQGLKVFLKIRKRLQTGFVGRRNEVMLNLNITWRLYCLMEKVFLKTRWRRWTCFVRQRSRGL